MSDGIIHNGVIISAVDGAISVALRDTSEGGCKGCALAGLCSGGQTVEIRYPEATPDLVGRKAMVMASATAGRMSLLLLVGVPLLLVLVALSIFSRSGMSQGASAVSALVLIGIWYIALYLLKDKIKEKVDFKVIAID